MKKTILLCFAALMVLFITSTAMSGASSPKKHLGIATYSVKGFDSDLEGSLKALQEDGFTVMEVASYDAAKGTVSGLKPADFAALVKKYGMEVISSHARGKFDVKDVEGTLAAWGKIFDDHKVLGCKYVIFPMNFWSNTVEALKAECALMNKIGDEANKRGIKFGYHNHNLEFAKIPGTDQFFEDFLIANTDPSKVFFQMDVYWVTIGGQNPVAYLQKYPDRFKLLHIKDEYVIGETGTIDFNAIFTQFYKNGYHDWFLEMEGKMTPEQHKQSLAMMESMKKRMAEGTGGNPFGPPPADQKPGNAPQGADKSKAPAPPMPGRAPQDPKVVAEQLKTSLDGIKQSAAYLNTHDFVK